MLVTVRLLPQDALVGAGCAGEEARRERERGQLARLQALRARFEEENRARGVPGYEAEKDEL